MTSVGLPLAASQQIILDDGGHAGGGGRDRVDFVARVLMRLAPGHAEDPEQAIGGLQGNSEIEARVVVQHDHSALVHDEFLQTDGQGRWGCSGHMVAVRRTDADRPQAALVVQSDASGVGADCLHDLLEIGVEAADRLARKADG